MGSRKIQGTGEADQKHEKPRRISPLEITTSALGLLLTLGMLAFIAWEALSVTNDAPPLIEVTRREPTAAAAGDLYVIEFDAVNRSARTAEQVEIEGALRQGGQTVETSRAILDFVPGGSTRHGGLFFTLDPSGHQVELRALGYSEP